ncbi:major capsid [Escherichia coli]|nr:major capsid [Escherichia coli]
MGSVATVPFRMRRRCLKVLWPLPVTPKHWMTVGDPAREFTMTQSAPLMVLPDPDEFVVVQVK